MPENQVRILWNAKDHPALPSGYGIIGKNLLPRFAEKYGPENVLVLAPIWARDRVEVWNGMKVLPGPSGLYGEEVLELHYREHNCTFLLQVGDWVGLRVIPKLAAQDKIIWVQWGPFDHLRYPPGITDLLRSAYRIVPWCKDGEQRFNGLGLTNITTPIPLGVDPTIWSPIPPSAPPGVWAPSSRSEFPLTMSSCGWREDTFNILIVAANQRRKYIREQLEGIALFKKAHPEIEVRLYYHGFLVGERNIQDDLVAVGLANNAAVADYYALINGGFTEIELSNVFLCADVVMDCCMEGFGLSTIQAQAMGTPVITMEEGAGGELTVHGAAVKTTWVDYHDPFIKPIPDPVTIATALGLIYERGLHKTKSRKAVEFVRGAYTWDIIAEQWFKFIEMLMEDRERFSMYVPSPSQDILEKAKRVMILE